MDDRRPGARPESMHSLESLLASKKPADAQCAAFCRYLMHRMKTGATDDELLSSAAHRGSAFHALLMALRLEQPEDRTQPWGAP